ncbi:hypothetical protein IFT43_20430 [Oxalobacteraceae sp. CFBP 13708]|nr:hypothetical protein [Oxalobacteraceae sp. CFBP 13708]
MNKSIVSHAFLLAVMALASGCDKSAQSDMTKSTVATPGAEAPPIIESKIAKKSYDGPFGLAAGISVAELKSMGFEESEVTPGVLRGTPPKPFSEPGEYAIVATPEAGLCRIRATFDVATVNGAGDQIKAKVDQLAETLQLKYGKHSTKIDYISRDVYRRNAEFWMMALREDSVVYAYDWSSGKTEQAMPNRLANIEVVANAIDSSSGFAAINYNFDNREACMTEAKKLKAANL